MSELLGATNPVPGYDNNTVNRGIPISPNDTQIQNIPDPGRVGRPDARTDQQDSGNLNQFGQIRYDSNFQTFLQRLRESPALAGTLVKLLAGQGLMVFSGMSEGIAAEMAALVQLFHMTPEQLQGFLQGQFKAGNRFGGALFALLRNAYARSGSESVRTDILQFLKTYGDFSSTKHLEGNLLRNLKGMADAMPARWGGALRELAAQLENGIAAGDRAGNLQLLKQEVFPYMSRYVEQTHDVGRARGLLTLMGLDIARYENGSEENLLQAFHRMSSYGSLKEQLGGVDDRSLLALLRESEFVKAARADQFSERLAEVAARALRGEGSAETQQVFRELVRAMLVNESVYMPLNHFLIPLEWEGKMLFSELWVDPNAEEKDSAKGSGGGGAMKFLFKMDVQSLGLFDIVLLSREREVELQVACPERVVPFAGAIESALAGILSRNGLTPKGVKVRKMERPVTLTEVFPKIFEGKNSVNVKV